MEILNNTKAKRRSHIPAAEFMHCADFVRDSGIHHL